MKFVEAGGDKPIQSNLLVCKDPVPYINALQKHPYNYQVVGMMNESDCQNGGWKAEIRVLNGSKDAKGGLFTFGISTCFGIAMRSVPNNPLEQAGCTICLAHLSPKVVKNKECLKKIIEYMKMEGGEGNKTFMIAYYDKDPKNRLGAIEKAFSENGIDWGDNVTVLQENFPPFPDARLAVNFQKMGIWLIKGDQATIVDSFPPEQQGCCIIS